MNRAGQQSWKAAPSFFEAECPRSLILRACILLSNTIETGPFEHALSAPVGMTEGFSERVSFMGDLRWGFLDCLKASSFSRKKRAAEHRPTHFPCGATGEAANKRFLSVAEMKVVPI